MEIVTGFNLSFINSIKYIKKTQNNNFVLILVTFYKSYYLQNSKL